MERLDRLEAIEEIRALKARYFRLIDTKQWEELRGVFAADLTIITPQGAVWLEGGDAYTASLQFGLEDAVSCHQGMMAEIEILSASTAKAVWAMQDHITWADKHPREGWKAITGRGHYHETYRKIERQWRIASLSLSRISLNITLSESEVTP